MGKVYDYKIREGAESAPAKLVALVGAGRKVLEIGCSSGSQTRVLSKEMGCEVVAVEIDPIAAERARPYCKKLIVGSIESVGADELAAGAPYDVVLFADVLEHLLVPHLALQKVRPLLSANGRLLASIPNVTHAALVFEMMRGRFEYRDYGLLDATHVHFFDRHEVLRVFEKAGYFVDRIERVVVHPADTEFEVAPVDAAERFVLDYMKRCNPDWDTFQFIVEAVPAATQSDSKSALEGARRRIETLEREVLGMRQALSRRESELEWLARGPWDRAKDLVRRVFSRGGGQARFDDH